MGCGDPSGGGEPSGADLLPASCSRLLREVVEADAAGGGAGRLTVELESDDFVTQALLGPCVVEGQGGPAMGRRCICIRARMRTQRVTNRVLEQTAFHSRVRGCLVTLGSGLLGRE